MNSVGISRNILKMMNFRILSHGREIWVLMSLLLLRATSTNGQASSTFHSSSPSSSSAFSSTSSSNISSLSTSILLSTLLQSSTKQSSNTQVYTSTNELLSSSLKVSNYTIGQSSQVSSNAPVYSSTNGLVSINNQEPLSTAAVNMAITQIDSPSQSICPVTASAPCTAKFIDIFAKNKSDPILPALQNQLLQGMHCDPRLITYACAIYIVMFYPAENRQKCIKIKTATQQGSVVLGKTNPYQYRFKTFTRFALMCLGNHLVPIAWNPNACSGFTSDAINKTTRAICSLAGKLSDGENSSSHFNLFCRDSPNPDDDPDIDPASMLASWYIGLGCDGMAPKNADPSLFVTSRDAISTMVVLIVFAVVCALAAFFFWPKWHVRDFKLISKNKKKERDGDGMLNDGFDYEGDSMAVPYEDGKKKIRPNSGPMVV